MEKVTEFLIDVVKQASMLITPEFEIKAKDDYGDLVTNFDLEIETFIIEKLKSEYPEFEIVSEEFNSKKELAKNCFVIDPIDGTVNFAHNIPLWGIQVACIENGETCCSVIYLPKFNELYYADKLGAFLNGKQIFVKQWNYNQALFLVEGGNKAPSLARIESKTKNYRVNNAICVDFAWVASGKYSGAIFKNDNYWDYIAGEYLVKQAGGVVINEKETHIAASNKEFAELLKVECGYYKNDIAFARHD